MSQVLPPSAIDWNHFFNLAATIAIVALAVVMATMVYFMVVNRERKGQARFVPELHLSKTRGRDAMVFALISIIILLSVSVAGARLTPNARFEPNASQSLVIKVEAYQWAFQFDYPNGVNSTNKLVVPENTTVMFNVTSRDVMHNFYLVQYKVSIDAIPGKSNLIWVTTPSLNGNSQLNYNIVCKELCGVLHTYMDASMTVTTLAAYNQWLSNQTAAGTSGG
jgi:cytochrome c oxidase subunit 2